MTEDERHEPSLRTLTPSKLSQRYMDFSNGDWYFAVSVAALAFTVYFALGNNNSLALFGLLLLGMGLLYRTDYCRIYQLPWQALHTLWIRYALKGRVWQAYPATPKHRLEKVWRQWRYPVATIPFEVYDLRSPEMDLGVIHNLDQGVDATVIDGTGCNIAAKELLEQLGLQRRLADVVRRIAAASAPKYATGVSYVFRRRPADAYRHDEYMDDNAHPDTWLPEAHVSNNPELLTDRDIRKSRLNHVMHELRDMVGTYTDNVTMAAVLTLKGNMLERAASKGESLAARTVSRQPIINLTKELSEGLAACGIEQDDPLDQGQLRPMDVKDVHALLNGAWAVTEAPDYYRMQAEGATEPVLVADQNGKEYLQYPALHWPKRRIDVTDDRCYIDNTEHAVLRAVSCPESMIPNFMTQLHTIREAYTTITLCGEATSGRNESRWINKAFGIVDSFDRTILGRARKSSRQERRERDLQAREQEIEQSGGFIQIYNILVCVSGTVGTDEVEKGINEARTKGTSAGVDLQLIQGECRQLPALWSATTGVNML